MPLPLMDEIISFERLKSRPVNMSKDPVENKITHIYRAGRTMDEQALLAFLDSNLPASWPLGIWTLKLQGYDYSHDGNGWWHVEARYQRRDFFDPEMRINTTGGTAHINLSKQTMERKSVDPAKEAPNYKGAIGVDGQTVHGCDIHVPAWEWEETYIKPAAEVDWLYVSNLFMLTGRTNDDLFRIFDPDEVLFLGAQGAIRGGDYWQFTYRFKASPNRMGTDPPFAEEPIGDTGVTIEVHGHETLWFKCTDSADAAAGNQYVRRPAYAYAERVYNSGDFSLLGLPADPLTPPAGKGMMAEVRAARRRGGSGRAAGR